MTELIINDIVTSFLHYAPDAFVTGGIFMAAVCIITEFAFPVKFPFIMRRNAGRFLLLYILYIYCYITAFITILSRAPGSRNSVELKLFETLSRNAVLNRYVVENFLLFIPLGLLLPFLWKKFCKIQWCLGAGLILSTLIETIQYITKRGYMQLDDIIMNTLGTAAGYAGGYFCIILLKKQYDTVGKPMS